MIRGTIFLSDDRVTLSAIAAQSPAGQRMRDRRLQRIKTIVQWQQTMAPEGNDHRLRGTLEPVAGCPSVFDAENRGMRFGRPHGPVGHNLPLPPLLHCRRADPVAPRQRPYALFTPLHRSPPGDCCAITCRPTDGPPLSWWPIAGIFIHWMKIWPGSYRVKPVPWCLHCRGVQRNTTVWDYIPRRALMQTSDPTRAAESCKINQRRQVSMIRTTLQRRAQEPRRAPRRCSEFGGTTVRTARTEANYETDGTDCGHEISAHPQRCS